MSRKYEVTFIVMATITVEDDEKSPVSAAYNLVSLSPGVVVNKTLGVQISTQEEIKPKELLKKFLF